MPLREKIDTDYKNALKSKDKIQISTYRLILSGIKDLDIVNRSGSNKKETNDEDIKKLLKKMIKQRSESIEVYKKNKDLDNFVTNPTRSFEEHFQVINKLNELMDFSPTFVKFLSILVVKRRKKRGE